MQRSQLFEDFGSLQPKSPSVTQSDDALEDAKLEAFEAGYKAGWDDSVKAQAQSTQHVSSALAANLQDASFQYHEMRASLNKTVHEILRQIVQKTLPRIAHASLGTHICDEIIAQVRAGLEAQVVLAVAPSNFTAVQALVERDLPEPVDLVEDPGLGPDQAVIRIGECETEIDMARVMAEIDNAVSAFFATHGSEVTND